MAVKELERGTIQGWHVLASMIAFFGVIFAVNGVFLFSALSTHTGIVSKQPYRKGLDYNNRIAADERQQKLGWRHEVVVDAKQRSIRVVLADRYGRPVPGLTMEGYLGRPSTEQFDVPVTLTETGVAGTYVAKLPEVAAGNWLVQLKASEQKSDHAKVVFRLRKRLWLKP